MCTESRPHESCRGRLMKTARQSTSAWDRGRVRQRRALAFTEASMHSFGCLVKNFQNFRKIKKCCKLSEKRTKPKNFEKFEKKFECEIFQKFCVLCAFWTISSLFWFFENFRNIQNSPHLMPCRTCLCRMVSYLLCLWRTRSLPHTASDAHSLRSPGAQDTT
jgi:hypothetical protein